MMMKKKHRTRDEGDVPQWTGPGGACPYCGGGTVWSIEHGEAVWDCVDNCVESRYDQMDLFRPFNGKVQT